MATILNLETATTNCSVSIARDGELISLKEENSANYSHSEQLHAFIAESLDQSGLKPEDLDAVAVSKGPGSYTGLRIGVSAAKGLCYALEIPLIAIGTLKSMATAITVREGYIMPLLDARRMEVYAAVFDHQHNEIKPTWAEIINEGSFEEYFTGLPVYLLGSGAEKCRDVLGYKQLIFKPEILPSAENMAILSYEKFKEKEFENTAYFEPFYLKDFIVTQPKKKN